MMLYVEDEVILVYAGAPRLCSLLRNRHSAMKAQLEHRQMQYIGLRQAQRGYIEDFVM
jgi:hypothetical protein